MLLKRAALKAERVSPLNVGAGIGESFPRRSRLTHAFEFRQVFKSNFRCADSCITILVGRKTGDGPRLGFAVARKQIPTAVKRNQLKRLFRESFRKAQHRLPAQDLVIMVRREILLIGPEKILAAMDQHWNSIIKKCENS
ncbi:MAG: ribonuclease P protein component [Gammaproteobacteria bacterium]|nr:ribonuclease P protein component [Gammaproteobacteria bacterium]